MMSPSDEKRPREPLVVTQVADRLIAMVALDLLDHLIIAAPDWLCELPESQRAEELISSALGRSLLEEFRSLGTFALDAFAIPTPGSIDAGVGCPARYEAEIQRLRGRERDLLLACNHELEKKRRFEAEANQQYCETILLRAECIRLRAVHSVLASFIEERHVGEELPEVVMAAIDAPFPPEVEA